MIGRSSQYAACIHYTDGMEEFLGTRPFSDTAPYAIKTFLKDFGNKPMPGLVEHPGGTMLPHGSGVTAVPFAEL